MYHFIVIQFVDCNKVLTNLKKHIWPHGQGSWVSILNPSHDQHQQKQASQEWCWRRDRMMAETKLCWHLVTQIIS